MSGFVHPKKIFKNYGCKPGDVLILTKQVGTGIVNTAIKGEMASAAAIREAEIVMSSLNKKAKEVGEEIKKANGDGTYLSVLASSGQFMVFTEGGIGTVLKSDMELPQPSKMPEQDSITLPTVTLEGLTEIDADHIIVLGTESDKADLESNSVWNEMRAVKNGNVTILDVSPYFSQAYNPMGRELLLESIKNELVK